VIPDNFSAIIFEVGGTDAMTLAHIVILLAAGLAAGFASGLLGLGGAFIMTPVQYLVFTGMGLPTGLAVKLAFGTSLLVVLPIAASGAWQHHRRGAVRWRVAVIMGGGSLVFALVGANIAAHLPGVPLKIAFGVVALLSGIRMLTAGQPQGEVEPVNNPWVWFAWAVPVGVVVGVLGVGGGVLLIPVMVLALKFEMHDAVATSLAVIMFTSTGGIIGYIANGIGVTGLPHYSIGYVNLPVWLLLAVPSTGMAQVGAVVAHRLPARQLSYVFTAIVFYMGLKMVGLFDWLGWPL
jgi:uncharacterized membrane protein YfcA